MLQKSLQLFIKMNYKTMSIQKKIEYLEFIKPKVEGEILKYRIGNRLAGGFMAITGTVALTSIPLTAPISIPLIIEGLGDTFSGQHHYFSLRIFKGTPSQELKKLRGELNNAPKKSLEIIT